MAHHREGLLAASTPLEGPGNSAGYWRALVKRRGDRRWDLLLRSTAVMALAGIALVLLIPASAPLVWLAVISLPANSPLSPLIPTGFEPIIMEAGKYESPLWVTVVATVGYMYTEYVNWYVFSWVLARDRLEAFRQSRAVAWGIRLFKRAPFWMVVIFAFTPLPFWAARSLAILNRYKLGWFLWATFLGRVPRFFIYAWFGEKLQVPTWMLLTVIVGGAVFVVLPRLLSGQPLLTEEATQRQGSGD